jgi:hypothetical protein
MSIGTKRNWSLIGVVALLALLLPLAATPAPTQAQTDEQCFPETGLCVSGRILQYWQQNGGLPVFGLPITPQREETIGDWTGQVQWFERNRLELHPENEPPFDVLLGRLGAEFVERDGGPPPREEPREGCTYFEQTGYNVCGDFLNYWSSNGLNLDGQPGFTAAESLALFGFPLTGEFEATLEDGNTYTVQWFERARFERHPENEPPFNVLLSRLGVAEVGAPEVQPVPGPTSGDPAPQDDEAAIIAAVEEYIGDPGFPYTVEVRCIVDGQYAQAFARSDHADGGNVLLRKENGEWQVVYFGPIIAPTPEFWEEHDFPTDFAERCQAQQP